MILLIPLSIFLVLSVMLIVVLSKTKPPSQQDTVEALCDAILRKDLITQSSLIAMSSIPEEVQVAIENLKGEHIETATSWHTEIEKTWDDTESTYSRVVVPIDQDGSGIEFTCEFVVNQWVVTSVKNISSKIDSGK